MLNVGPKPDGTIPDRAAQSLRSAGEWIKKYPKVVYGTEASPWKHTLPWGDVTVKKNKLFLAVYQWPTSGLLYLPGLKTEILEAKLLNGKNSDPITFSRLGSWLYFNLPYKAPEKWISVIEVTLKDKPEVDPIHAIDPEIGTNITADFAEVENCEKNRKSWMEKFGEWKHVLHINRWKENAKATWEVEVMKPGDYKVDLTYSGNGRLVWSVETDEGVKIKNQQNSSHIYSTFPIGFINFKTIGKHTVSISLKEGDFEKANLTAIKLTPMEY